MKEDEHIKFPWLVDNIHRARALIKYDIKLLDIKLHHMMAFKWIGCSYLENNTLKLAEEIILCCSELIKRHEELLHVMHGTMVVQAASHELEQDPATCFDKIQQIKLAVSHSSSTKDEIQSIQHLIFYYKNLEVLLTNCSMSYIGKSQHQTATFTNDLSMGLKGLLQANNLKDWLMAIVAFSREFGENTVLYRLQLIQLKDADLQSIYKIFDYSDYVILINSLFYYKIDPQRLYDQPVHPEKLISLRARLSGLYAFIELIHESVTQILRQRGYNVEHDYLFHGNDIPQGVVINDSIDIKELVAMVVKEWRLTHLAYPDENINFGKIDDIFVAYQFWFNPDRLIDAVMALQNELVRGNESFSNALLVLYKKLSTMRCVELYGYFSNKSSCYLMRTLFVISEGGNIPAIPVLSYAEKKLIKKVYEALDCVMNTLRDELECRHVITASYPRHQTGEIKPGRRIIQAINRIVNLYSGDEKKTETNEVLEGLFKDIEMYHQKG